MILLMGFKKTFSERKYSRQKTSSGQPSLKDIFETILFWIIYILANRRAKAVSGATSLSVFKGRTKKEPLFFRKLQHFPIQY